MEVMSIKLFMNTTKNNMIFIVVFIVENSLSGGKNLFKWEDSFSMGRPISFITKTYSKIF